MVPSARTRAALLLLTAMLPIASGLARAYEGMRGPRPHFCVCPLDGDGHCLCPECIRLGIHDRQDDAHEGEDEHAELAIDPGPVLASACAPAPDEDPPPLTLERAILPAVARVVALEHRALLERAHAPPLRPRAPEPPVPPPRLG